MIDQDKSHPCGKPCIANVSGRCAVQVCGGPISRLAVPGRDLDTAAWAYGIARDTFDELFDKEDVHEH